MISRRSSLAVTLLAGCRLGWDAGPVDEISIVNPGCEDGLTNRTTFVGTLSISTTAHSGSASCQVCCTGQEPYCTLGDVTSPVTNPVMGDVYRAEAWVRAVPGGSMPRNAFAKLREWLVENQVQGDIVIGPGVPMSETAWNLVTVTKTVIEAAPQSLDVFIHQDAQANDCFLIDDIRLFHEQ